MAFFDKNVSQTQLLNGTITEVILNNPIIDGNTVQDFSDINSGLDSHLGFGNVGGGGSSAGGGSFSGGLNTNATNGSSNSSNNSSGGGSSNSASGSNLSGGGGSNSNTGSGKTNENDYTQLSTVVLIEPKSSFDVDASVFSDVHVDIGGNKFNINNKPENSNSSNQNNDNSGSSTSNNSSSEIIDNGNNVFSVGSISDSSSIIKTNLINGFDIEVNNSSKEIINNVINSYVIDLYYNDKFEDVYEKIESNNNSLNNILKGLSQSSSVIDKTNITLSPIFTNSKIGLFDENGNQYTYYSKTKSGKYFSLFDDLNKIPVKDYYKIFELTNNAIFKETFTYSIFNEINNTYTVHKYLGEVGEGNKGTIVIPVFKTENIKYLSNEISYYLDVKQYSNADFWNDGDNENNSYQYNSKFGSHFPPYFITREIDELTGDKKYFELLKNHNTEDKIISGISKSNATLYSLTDKDNNYLTNKRFYLENISEINENKTTYNYSFTCSYFVDKSEDLKNIYDSFKFDISYTYITYSRPFVKSAQKLTKETWEYSESLSNFTPNYLVSINTINDSNSISYSYSYINFDLTNITDNYFEYSNIKFNNQNTYNCLIFDWSAHDDAKFLTYIYFGFEYYNNSKNNIYSKRFIGNITDYQKLNFILKLDTFSFTTNRTSSSEFVFELPKPSNNTNENYSFTTDTIWSYQFVEPNTYSKIELKPEDIVGGDFEILWDSGENIPRDIFAYFVEQTKKVKLLDESKTSSKVTTLDKTLYAEPNYINKETKEPYKNQIFNVNNIFYGTDYDTSKSNYKLITLTEKNYIPQAKEDANNIAYNLIREPNNISVSKNKLQAFNLKNDINLIPTGNLIYNAPQYSYHIEEINVSNKYYSSFSYEHSYELTRVGGGGLLNEYPDPIEGISGTVIICEPINKDNISEEKKTEIKTGRVKINSKDYTISYTYNLTYYYEDFGGSGLSFNKYIVNDEYWDIEYKEQINPLVNISYNYNQNPITISDANIGIKKSYTVINEVYFPEVTYTEHVKVIEKSTEYVYFDSYGVSKKYVGDIININNEFYGQEITYTGNVIDKDGNITSEVKSTYNLIKVYPKTVVSDSFKEVTSIYQNEHYGYNLIEHDSYFRLANNLKVVIDKNVSQYVEPAYTYIISKKSDGNYNIEYKKVREGFYTYAYDIIETPFLTDTTVNFNSDFISKLDKYNSTLTSGLKDVKVAIEKIKFDSEINLDKAEFNLGGDVSEKLDKISEAISNGGSSEPLDNISNNVNNVSENIVKLSDALTNNISNSNKEFEKISYNIDIINTTKLNGNLLFSYFSNTTSNNFNELNKTFSSIASNINNMANAPEGRHVLDIFNYLPENNVNVSVVGTYFNLIMPTEVKSTYTIPGSKLGGVKTETIFTERKQSNYFNDEIEIVSYNQSLSYINPSELGSKLMFYLDKKTSNYEYDGHIFKIDEYTYLSIPDLLYRLGNKIPSKNEFIINLSTSIYGNIVNSSSISPSEQAKQSIYKAYVLWDELNKEHYFDKEIEIKDIHDKYIENIRRANLSYSMFDADNLVNEISSNDSGLSKNKNNYTFTYQITNGLKPQITVNTSNKF